MKTPANRPVTVWLIPLLTLILGWQLGMHYEQKAARTVDAPAISDMPKFGTGTIAGDPEKEADMSLLWETWRTLQKYYIQPNDLKTNNMVYGAVQGMVQGVGDPYTVFMTPTQDTDFKQSLDGKLEGIGAELADRNGMIVVVSPLKGSPAEKAGLLPNDVVVKVDGNTIEGQTLQQVVQKIRGTRGTKVKLLLYHEGQNPREVTIVRDAIHIPSVESKILKTQTGSLGYVALNQFGDTTIDEVRTALADFKKGKEPLKGLIIDLRYNGGGYLEGAVDLVSMFLKKGVIVSVQERSGAPAVHEAYGAPLYPDIPLVVLINEGTASASEITAGALQDWNRAKIIGVKSYGKGTVQEIIGLPGGASLRVTIAHWLTPKGKNLGKEGVMPDINVERTVEDAKAERDPQLTAAERWLLEKKDMSKMMSSSSSSSSKKK